MSVYFKGVSPTLVWNDGTEETDLTNKNNIPAQVFPGGVISFQSYESWYPGFNYNRVNQSDAIGTTVLDSSFSIEADNLAATGYGIFTNIGSTITLSPTYTDTATEIIVIDHNDPWGSGGYPKSEETDTQKQLLSPISLSQLYATTLLTELTNSVYLTLNDVGTSAIYSRYNDNIISISVDGDENITFTSNIGNYSGAILDGEDYGIEITDTDISVIVNGIAVFTESRTVSYTLSGAALLDGHTLDSLSGDIPPIMTENLNIPIDATPGLYTITATFNDGQVGTATYEVLNSSAISNSPDNGSCWETGEIIEIEANTGNISSIVSLTPGLTGTSGGTGTPNATFTITNTNNLSTGTIRVTTSNGDVDDFILNLCFMLPPITNTVDDPNITTDDAANLPPTSIYQCVGVAVDVEGPSFPSGDVTWSVLNSLNVAVVSGVTITGQNTESIVFSLDDTVAPGNYTLRAVETATPANVSTHAFTLLALPPITITTNQPYVGGQTQFNTTFPFGIEWGPAEVNIATGLATWATAGTKTVSYTPDTISCPVELSYVVYEYIDVAEYDGVNCVYINSGDTLQLTVTGGSGNYSYVISGQNIIDNDGLITAGIYAGEYTVSVIDETANIIFNFPICIGTQSQFCAAIEAVECADTQAEPCCELLVNCGETINLSIPSFHLRVNGKQEEVLYSASSGGTTDVGGYLRSGSSVADAKGNVVNCTDDEALFEIITNLDMAATGNAAFGIGFTSQDVDSGVDSIDIGVVWYTSAGVRKVEVRQNGVVEAGSTFNILQGDVVSAGFKNGKFVLYINNLLKFEATDYSCCGTKFLDVSIEEPNKSLGGSIVGPTWTIITPGNVSEVGTINSAGVYNSPTDAFSLVEAQAVVGNGTFRVRIRNIKPTIRYTDPNAFLAGKAVTLWVGPYIPNLNEPIRLAKDGSPDALQNPGMIECGVLEGSANFQEAFDYQDFENDLGQIYQTSLIKESASLAATFLEVRDLIKMSKLKPEATLHAKNRGVTEFSVGGKSCSVKELRAILVIGQPGCDEFYDVLYLPRVQNKGNLGLEVGKKTNGKYELSLTALPDYTRPRGSQLYSIYQIDDCSSTSCN